MDRIYWQGASRVAQLRKQMEARVQSWARDWAGSRWDGLSVSMRPESAITDSGLQKIWLLSSDDGAAMLVSADNDVGCQLAQSALGLDRGQGERLVDGVGKRCISALLDSLWGTEMTATLGATEMIAPHTFASRHGGVAWRIEGLPGAFEVAVNGGWCSIRLPNDASNRPSSKLTSRRKAIADLRVPVGASIELGTIELLDSLQLRVGEVLLTDVSQQPRVRVGTRSGEIRTGRIVPEHRQRTVVLD